MRSAALIAGLILWAGPHGAAFAQSNLKIDCPQLVERKGTQHVYTLKDIPEPIVNDLLRRFRDLALQAPGFQNSENYRKLQGLADRDGEWNPYDTMPPWAPSRRFMQGGHEGLRWYVWYESGGYTRTVHAAIYELNSNERNPRLISQFSTLRERLCVATAEAFARPVDPFYEADSW